MKLKILFGRLFSEQAVCLLCNRTYHPARAGSDSGGLSLCHGCSSRIEWIEGPLCAVCGRMLPHLRGGGERGLQPAGARQSEAGSIGARQSVPSPIEETPTGAMLTGATPTGVTQTAPGNLSRPEICGDCARRPRTYFIRNRSAVTYSPLMKEWMYTYKYRGRERLSEGLAALLHRAYLLHYRGIPFRAVTFVPLHAERLRERKFNQAEQLARQLAERVQIPLEPTLMRIQDTPKQSKRRRSERIRGLRGAFRYIGGVPKGPVLLVDDIYTTGSTLNECARVLSEHGWQEIYALTVARA